MESFVTFASLKVIHLVNTKLTSITISNVNMVTKRLNGVILSTHKKPFSAKKCINVSCVMNELQTWLIYLVNLSHRLGIRLNSSNSQTLSFKIKTYFLWVKHFKNNCNELIYFTVLFCMTKQA